MQPTLSFLVLALTMAVAMASDFAPVVIFNDNKEDPTKSCSPVQWALVTATIDTATTAPVRRLGGTAKSKGTNNMHRKLACTCGDKCYYAGPGCPYKARRRTQEEPVNAKKVAKSQKRQLSTEAACQAQVTAIHQALNTLAPTLATTCQALLAAPLRSVTCAPSTLDCDVSNLNLINVTAQAIHTANVNATGLSFCKNMKMTFQASTEFFVGRVNFIMTGPNGFFANRTEVKAPYYMHGNKGTSIDGNFLPTGNYTLTVKSEYDPAQAKTIRFRANNC